MTKGRILLVEDEEVLRSSLRMFLVNLGFEVVEAADEGEAVGRLNDGAFNLVVTDLFLSDGSGFEILKYVQDNRPEAKCIVITGHASLDSAIRALRKGAFDYLLKPFEYIELKAAVDRAFTKQSQEKLVRKLDFQQVAREYSLTRKELEIVKVIITEGLSNAEISEALGISQNTAKVHLRNIFRKMNVESKTALTTTLLTGGPKQGAAE